MPIPRASLTEMKYRAGMSAFKFSCHKYEFKSDSGQPGLGDPELNLEREDLNVMAFLHSGCVEQITKSLFRTLNFITDKMGQ